MRRALLMSVLALCLGNAVATQAGVLLQVDGRPMRWSPEGPGKKTVITYALLSAPYTVQSNRSILSPSNCAHMRSFADIVAISPGVTEEAAKTELREALRTWESVANITFEEVSDPSRAQIVIGAANDPGGRAFANLSYRSGKGIPTPVTMALGKPGVPAPAERAPLADDGDSVAIDQAYVCLNPKSPWKVGFDGNLNVYDLRHTFTHEVGHAIGLDHPDATGAIMGYRYDERVRTLQPSDIAGVQRLYGVATER